MTFKYRYKKQIIACSFVAAILLVLGGFIIQKNFSGKKEEKKKMSIVKKDTKSSLFKKDEKDAGGDLYVDIKGEVLAPGTYLVEDGKRVKDVVEMAGGLTDKADTSVINLSKKISDEMVIIIYSKWEVQNFVATKEKEKAAIEGCQFSEEYQLKNDACIDSEQNSDSTQSKTSNTTSSVSLNNATKEELMSLTGIGEAKALDIINYRNSNGGFKSIEEVKNVKGIGDAVFAKIKDRLTL